MTNKIDPKDWAKEFESFMEGPEIAPPQELSQKVLGFVRNELNPRILSIVSKLAAIHVVVGSLSLLICSQFGMGTGEMLFMGLGEVACTLFCGALFLGASTFVAGFVFSKDELRKIRRTAYSPILALGILSLSIFLFFGAEIALNLAVVWLIGALGAGVIATELSIRLRTSSYGT